MQLPKLYVFHFLCTLIAYGASFVRRTRYVFYVKVGYSLEDELYSKRSQYVDCLIVHMLVTFRLTLCFCYYKFQIKYSFSF